MGISNAWRMPRPNDAACPNNTVPGPFHMAPLEMMFLTVHVLGEQAPLDPRLAIDLRDIYGIQCLAENRIFAMDVREPHISDASVGNDGHQNGSECQVERHVHCILYVRCAPTGAVESMLI